MSKQNCSDQIVEYMTTLGIERIFGIPGDTIDSLMESLRKQKKIQFIVMRHEEVGAFAACASAKLTGKLEVVAACQGPGANHLINGLYDAKLDNVPLIAITGQVASNVIGTRMPQETNQYYLFEDCTVFNEEVRSAANLPMVLERAVSTALARKGPAHISIPSDIMREAAVKWSFTTLPETPDIIIKPSDSAINKAADLINKTEKISILYGEGARPAYQDVIELSKKIKAPLIHTTRSKDIIPDSNPYNMGGIGIMGSRAGNKSVYECELLVIIGSRFAWKEFYPKNSPIIQIDHEQSNLGIRVDVSNPLVGDSMETLKALIPLINEKTNDRFAKHCTKYKTGFITHMAFDPKTSKPGDAVHPQALVSQLNDLLDDDAIVCVDTGTVTPYCNNIIKIKPQQRFIWNANLASLGAGLPYSIGCQFVNRDRQVVCVAGDGGFQMAITDLPTMVFYNLPIICIIFNNSVYGFIELEEEGEGDGVYGTKFENPDYAKVAEAHGAKGYTIKQYSDIEPVLKQAFKDTGTRIIDAHVNPDELLIPPIINPAQVEGFAESRIKTWYADIKYNSKNSW